MSRKFEYVVVKLADVIRGESLNAALAIFDQNSIDIRIPRRVEKLKAMSHALDLDAFKESVYRLAELDRYIRESGAIETEGRVEGLRTLTGFEFSETAWFDAPTSAAYETCTQNLLRLLIEPEPARLKTVHKRTRLLSVVKKAFKSERVLAKKGEDLSSHRIVSNYTIAEGLDADFILKNGAMHVIETVDASDDQFSARKVVGDIAISALVLEQARMTFGEATTSSRLVYDATSALERIATPSLEAAAHQGTALINWASADDRRRLLVELSSLATPFEQKGSKTHLTATTQAKLSLH